jgi:ribonuclease J
LAGLDVEIITSVGNELHVSGHPCEDELRDMYSWARPRIAVPVHGEHRHLLAHAELAKKLQVPEPVRIHNGDMLRLWPGAAEVVDVVPHGRYYLDGKIMLDSKALAMRERRKASYNGVVFIALPIDAADRLAGSPRIELLGVPEHDGAVAMIDWVYDVVERTIPSNGRLTPSKAETSIRNAVRRELTRRWGKKPSVIVTFVDI